MKRNSAFTLLEISIAIVVIALAYGAFQVSKKMFSNAESLVALNQADNNWEGTSGSVIEETTEYDPNLTHYYPFSATDTYTDLVSGYNLTLVNNGYAISQSNFTDDSGRSRESISFQNAGVTSADSSNSFLNASNHVSSFLSPEVSISFWVYYDYDLPGQHTNSYLLHIRDTSKSSGDGRFVINMSRNASQNYSLLKITAAGDWSGTPRFQMSTPSSMDMGDGDWHHVVILYSETIKKTYIDNQLINMTILRGSESSSVTLDDELSDADVVVFGVSAAQGTSTNLQAGARLRLSEFRFYDDLLTEQEIADLYNEVSEE